MSGNQVKNNITIVISTFEIYRVLFFF